ncbi:hypothetical protein BGX23_001643 [Mortierella sp. AD031]|nr:hypothetical protein BGX23_001643 [Mortierella sp. AD031]
MNSPKQDKPAEKSRSASFASSQSGSMHSKSSSISRIGKATKNLLRPPAKEDRSLIKGLATVQHGPLGIFIPKDDKGCITSTVDSGIALTSLSLAVSQSYITLAATDPDSKALPIIPVVTTQSSPTLVTSETMTTMLSDSTLVNQEPWLTLFPQNVTTPLFSTALPPLGARFETTAHLAYCSNLLRMHLSLSSTAGSLMPSLDASQQASIEPFVQDEEEQNRVLWLTQRAIEEFMVNGFKSSALISEVMLLGPSLNKEYYRELLNCLISEFETAKLLDIDLLQEMVQLVQCAGPDYLQPDDLTAQHHYYLVLALSRLLDAMVEGKVKDLDRVVDHEPLSALLGQMSDNSDLFLKHQAAYALQGLLHVPNDETRRECVLRHSGNIAMGLLGVASVCNLDFSRFPEGAGKVYDATVETLEIATKMKDGAQSAFESGQGVWASMKGSILSGGRLLWYTALREAQEYVRNGRLVDFNRLVFEAPCYRDVEFQWEIYRFLGEIAIDSSWTVATRQHAANFLAELYRNDSICSPDEEIDKWILTILRQISDWPDLPLSDHARSVLQGLRKEGAVAKQELYCSALASLLTRIHCRSSTLLDRVQSVVDVDRDLHMLRKNRLKERENVLYIPPQARPTLQSSDDTLFPLMEKALEFLDSDRQVLLLLGDSGAGKSTFNLELENTL